MGWEEVDPEGRREQSAPGKQLARPPARPVSRSAIAGAGAWGPGRPGQARGESGGRRPAPRPPAAPRARGRPGQVLALPGSRPLARVLRCVAARLTARG